MRMLLAVVVSLTSIVGAGRVTQAENVFQQTLRSTVWVITDMGAGSGVVVDLKNKHVLTNFHVVGQSDDVTVCFPVFEEGRLVAHRSYYISNLEQLGVKGKVIARDPFRDLVIIELDSLPESATAIRLGESVSPPQLVHSIGNPSFSDALWVYSSGSVRSAYQKTAKFTREWVINAMVLETTIPFNPGDSGGPVVNNNGELVAIAQSLIAHGNDVGVCIDVTEVKEFLENPAKPPTDPKVEVALKAVGLDYEHNSFGTFAVDCHFNNGEIHRVYVSSHESALGSQQWRDVWAPAFVLHELLSSEVANLLLIISSASNGAWQITEENDHSSTLEFRIQIPAHSDNLTLHAAILQAATAARNLQLTLR